MVSALSRVLRRTVNTRLAERGYALRWLPPRVLASRRVIEVDFTMLAARLMLRVPRPYFIGIGANDGVTGDPLHPFIRDHGWRGLMVEPIPEAFAALERNYAGFDQVGLVQAAIGPQDGSGTIYSVEAPESAGMGMTLHSSFDRAVLLKGTRWFPGLEERIVARPVPVMSFATLLGRTGGQAVDVLKIDTEGYDFEILRTVDLARLDPSLLIVEYANLPRETVVRMADLLLDHGYRLTMTRLDMLGWRD
jgi:FkbM family methyltransferase